MLHRSSSWVEEVEHKTQEQVQMIPANGHYFYMHLIYFAPLNLIHPAFLTCS